MDELNKWYQKPITYSEADAILQENFSGIKRSFVAVGYYLKRIRDDELFREGGYKSVWDYAEDRYGIKRTTASRWMSINDKFSEDGNSPNLAERYADFGKGQLQEMLYLEEEQLDKITPDMTVKEIREVRAPEKKLVNPDQNQTEYLNAFARYFIDCKHDWLLKDFQNRVMNVSKSPVEIKNHLGVDNRTWHFAVDNGVAHINLFDDYVQLWGENNMYIGNFDWFYLAAALQRMWNIVAMENAEKKQNTECATSHKTGTCIHRPEFACTLPEASKIAVGDGIDCNVKCCWDCPNRMECGYRCNSAAGHPVEEQVVEECATSHTEATADEHEEDIGEIDTEEPDVIVDADFKELPEEQEEKTEKTSVRSDKELLKEMLEKEQTYLKDFLKYYTEKDVRVRQQKIKVAALAGMLCDLDIDDQETVQEEQPELPVLKNNDQRKEFIDNYTSWPLWIETKETGERYYKYDFCNGTSAVVKVYFHKCFDFMSTAGTRYEERYKDGYGAEEYYLLMNGKHFKDCRTNMSALIEHLKNLKKGEKNGEKR